MNRIKDKLVLITGASAGIGRACAERFAADGARLLLTARRLPRLEQLKTKLEQAHSAEVHVFALDVRDRDAVSRLAGELSERDLVPDVLVNNAGLASGLDKLQEGRLEDWDRMIDTNVKGLLFMSRAILPLMLARGRGHVVNLGSIAGRQVYPAGNVYNATKFAVRALTEAMNADLLGTPIRVSSVSPGLVETEFSEVRFHGDKERAAKTYAGTTPLTAEDVADAVAYVVNAPAHVCVHELIIMPTAQRNVYLLDRRSAD